MGSYAKGIKVWRAEEADGDGGVDDVDGLERWIETEPHPSAPSALPPSPEGEGLGTGWIGQEGQDWGGLADLGEVGLEERLVLSSASIKETPRGVSS